MQKTSTNKALVEHAYMNRPIQHKPLAMMESDKDIMLFVEHGSIDDCNAILSNVKVSARETSHAQKDNKKLQAAGLVWWV